VTDPERGDSVGSRVRLGTLGHHDDWRYANQTLDVEGTVGVNVVEEPGDGFGPGFGVGGALAGVGGAGYLLYRRLSGRRT
jgi:PGF-CTERM protein